ncbi:MAG: permease-like cell division protein FtsX [Rikenellaceae bacterium]
MARRGSRKLTNKVRNAYIVSTTSITLVLFLLGSVGYIMLNIWSGAQKLQESLMLNVMLESDVTLEQKTALENNTELAEVISSMQFVTKEQAAKEFKEYIGDDFVEFLDQNPLPDSFEISLKSEYSDKQEVATLVRKIEAMEGVDEVIYQRGVVEQISDNMGKFTLILLLFGGTLLVISLILLNNTIKVAIFSRRYIINTMKLVGATRGFIIKPFVAAAARQGIIAGLIASLMFVGLTSGINEKLPDVSIISNKIVMSIILGMIVMGAIISLSFTFFAVIKFVNMNTNKMHSL